MKKLKLKLLAITVATTTIATIVPSIGVSAVWKENQGNWYYLNDSGEVKKGWINDNSKWYYLNNLGEMKTGWVNDNGTWYYLNNSGEMKTGWVNDNGTWYYLNNSGKMKTGWVNDNGTWYYLNNSGAMKTGWVNESGTWYYLNNSGAMKTGWINDNGTWYFSDISGAMQTGVVQVEGKTYYLSDATGAMQIGNVIIDEKTYTFARTGEVVGTDLVPTKVFNSNGVKITENNNSNNTPKTNEETTSTNSSSGGSRNSSNNGNVNTGKSTKYLEDYREQYHYSVADAWANDPNGMVYFNGEWHLFYQYYPDDNVWGPMHWGHAVSKDLIHWNELGIALAPDGNVPTVSGYDEDWYKYGENWIYSGCAVVDKDNTTGFFDGIEGGGLVVIYTQHVENPFSQQQAIAYSKDNGRTWIKPEVSEAGNNIVLSTAQDPLNKVDGAFRDPKIVYLEDSKEWLMVVAGGPLRFFSSKDLNTWKAEAMQPEIGTECPDIFKLEVGNTGKYKWVLSEGGRYYRVGDLKKVDDVWTFAPDEDQHLVMNFVKDAYAAQTYYGTGENGTPDGRRIMINWMNNWDYCNAIAPITRTFNGQFTLQNELKLVETDDGIRMIQQPIEEYKTLRKSPITFENVTISLDQPNIMSNLSGSQYEIVAEFEPDENTTEFGFKLRVGKDADQETIVKYNTETEELIFDRTKSGKAPSNSSAFLQSYSSKINKTSDGKIQLNIFVDSSSVEVYGNNGEVTGSGQVFPNRSSQGIEVYSLGGNTSATIKYYPLSGIWNNGIEGNNSVLVSLSEGNFSKEVGDEFTIYTTTIPTTAAQGVTWNISDSSVVKIISKDDQKTTFRVLSEGSATLTATSKDGKTKNTATLSTLNRNLPNNFLGLTNVEVSGDWYKDGDAYVASSSGDAFAMVDEINYDSTATYTFETDVEIVKGIAGLVLGSVEKNSPTEGSIVANLSRNGAWRLFKFPGGANLPNNEQGEGNVTPAADGKYKITAVLKGNHVQYYINGNLVSEADYNFSGPGNFGFNIFNGEVRFANAKLTVTGSDTSALGIVKTNYQQNLGDEFTIYANQNVKYNIGDQNVVQIINGTDSKKTTFKVVGTGETTITVTPISGSAAPVTINVSGYDTNPDNTEGLITGLKNFTTSGAGKWYVKTDPSTGGVSYAVKSTGDTFAMSSTKIAAEEGANYTLETEATVLNPSDNCAPSLVLFSKTKETPTDGSLVFNIQTNNGHWKVFEFGGSLVGEGNITPAEDGKYDLKADVVGQTIKYSINGEEVLSTPNFSRRSGYVGLMSWNANVEFRNTVFKSVDQSATLGIATSYEKIKGEEFTINANQSINYTSADPTIVDVESGNNSNSTTFKVNEVGTTTITAKSVNNSNLTETITVTGLETDPTIVSGLVEGLYGFNTIGGKWYVKDDAYVSEGSGDKFAISDNIVNVTTGAACTLSTNATIKSDGAAALILSNDKENPFNEGSIIANVNKNGEWRIFRFPECDNLTDVDGNECRGNLGTVPEDGVYELKMEVNGTEIEYYINDELVTTIDTSNYDFEETYVGLMNWDAKIEFRDIELTFK